MRSAIVSIRGRSRATCRFLPLGDLWECGWCWRVSPVPVSTQCPTQKEITMRASFGFAEFLRAVEQPGVLTVALRGAGGRAALAWQPNDPPHSWAPAIWRPSRLWAQQRVDERTPHALLAEVLPGHALKFSLPADTQFQPCRTRGPAHRYEVRWPQVSMASTAEVLHRRPGGEVS